MFKIRKKIKKLCSFTFLSVAMCHLPCVLYLGQPKQDNINIGSWSLWTHKLSCIPLFDRGPTGGKMRLRSCKDTDHATYSRSRKRYKWKEIDIVPVPITTSASSTKVTRNFSGARKRIPKTSEKYPKRKGCTKKHKFSLGNKAYLARIRRDDTILQCNE